MTSLVLHCNVRTYVCVCIPLCCKFGHVRVPEIAGVDPSGEYRLSTVCLGVSHAVLSNQ